MASTPASITAPSEPYQKVQNHQHPQNNFRNSQRRHRRQTQTHSRKFGFARPPIAPSNVAGPTAGATTHPPPSGPSTFHSLSPDFSGRRSTRLYSKMHLGRPKTTSNSPHSSVSEEVLQYMKNSQNVENILFSFESELRSSDDYTYLVKELGNLGECEKALTCFQFAIARERRRIEQGKLASTMISTLGRLGKVELAESIFETAFNEGYGNTVYGFSALIGAYAKSGLCDEALKVFDSLKDYGITPNLVTYNAVIDACGKGGVEFSRVMEIFNEMVRNGIQPDRITFNSLLAVCSRVGAWETARNLFSEMIDKGIEPDVFTYNTLLDAICKGGQMDLAFHMLQEMPKKGLKPNVVTYSTMIDGYSKVDRYDDALHMFGQMRYLGIALDRVLYNTLLTVYGRLGRFKEVLDVCKEMEAAGISRDIVTYNALLDAYGKQGMFDEVKKLSSEMKADKVTPNLLTYSTLMDGYSKAGLYKEAMEVLREYRQAGLKADVVLYSAVIDAVCKNGLVESAVSLLDDMIKEGIRPNVVTYNSIIDAFGYLTASECTLQTEPSTLVAIEVDAENKVADLRDNQIMQVFGRLASEKGGQGRQDNRGRRELFCILELFRKMHHLNIKPNVVTFSAILNACSRCKSFNDASMLLEELRLFDNQVYGVAYGLLMGYSGNVWFQARSLFDELRLMDSETASAFYNALTDVLWHFDQRYGAKLVVLEGKNRQVWDNVWSDSCLDLHLMSSGAAQAMVHAWLLNIHSIVIQGHQLPELLSILTGWGKHSKVVGAGTLRRVVEELLKRIGAPFQLAKCNLGRFVSQGSVVAAWLRESGTLNVLVLRDARTQPGYPRFGHFSNLQPLTL
ncbi:hypothetical protein SLA2020_170850 [Shorea laevis]